MKRLITILLTACLLLSVVAIAVPLVFAADDDTPTFNTTVPTAFWDFTTQENADLFTDVRNVTHKVTEGEYTTFTATANDPYTNIKTPSCFVYQAAYASVHYRTTSQDAKVEFYCARSDGANMGAPGTQVEHSLTGSGNWETATFACNSYASASKEIFFSHFRIDPLQRGSEIKAGESIDIQYVALFATEADAQGFNYDEYKKQVAYEEEQKRLEEEANKTTNWPDPEFKPMQSIASDTYAGTLKYTPSADGKTMTISYEAGGETYSYTVPNNKNYLFGGYAGTDDLDRSLYTSDTVGSYTADERYVGLFYFLWQGEHGDSGVYDLQKIYEKNGAAAASKLSSGLYGPDHAMHWFAEPLYGYYYANDTWVLRKHAELLTNANIDFLYFDVTNNVTYSHNALALMEILHELNEQGYDAPQVVFYTHTNASETVNNLYNDIYKINKYPDTWFRINGKPVIIAPNDITLNDGKKITDFFTVKREQWPNDPTINVNAWPWMDFEWPQRVFNDENGKPSAISVSIAQHSGTVCFTDSSLYNNSSNRGRSFNGATASSDNLAIAYRNWKKDPTLTNQGLNFQAQFDYAIKSQAQFILVTGWNEWVAQRQPSSADKVIFVDTASMEFSRDAEMMRGGYFDNYYMQLIYNVQRVKGTAPIIVQDSRTPINVTGSFSQWDDVLVEYTDPAGDTAKRDAITFGNQKVTNTTGRNDIVTAKVTNDTQNVYFYVQTVDDVTMYDGNTSWMQLYIDIDSDASTGWYGYDYIINNYARSEFSTTVAKYTGTNGAYKFSTVGKISYRAKDNEMMIAVPQSMLGIENFYEINFQFKWADSSSQYIYNEMEDFYCDGDVAPLGRLNFVYQNYLDGKAVAPELDTTPVVDQAPETDESGNEIIETELEESADESTTAADESGAVDNNETTDDSDEITPNDTTATIGESDTTVVSTEDPTDPTGGGCSSAVLTASVAVLISLGAAALTLRKKE